MSYLISTIITGVLLLVFVLTLFIERKRGKRFLEPYRARLDRKTARLFYVVQHVDWSAFFSHLFKLTLEKVAHDIVHGSLIVIRSVEKGLTRAIRVLRTRLAHRNSGAKVEGFQIKNTLQQFRKSLHKDEKK